MKTCLICDQKLGWIKFKSIEGSLCKNCYEQASQNFTTVVKNKTKAEILTLIKQTKTEKNPHFEISRKINQILLFDDQHQQLCIPNHPKYSREKKEPAFYAYDEVRTSWVTEECFEAEVKKQKQTLGTLKVEIQLANSTAEIWLIPKPINISSMPYRTMTSLAQQIVTELQAVSLLTV